MKKIQTIHFLNFIDNCTRYTISIPIKHITSRAVVNAFKKHQLDKYQTPDTILCDHGVQYTPFKFRNLCKERGIEIKYCIKNNPQGNGLIERRHRIINEILRMNRT